MRTRIPGFATLACVLFLAPGLPAQSQTTIPPQTPPRIEERVEVVATRIPEPPDEVAAPIEVITGAELRARGVNDLAAALALAAGVDIAPGGDNGPAGAVPDFWGLKEFDAFLLVVDGVPWGGAFNPELTTLSLRDVERIEVLRGPAPVTYGATSFVGVIHVVHKNANVSGGGLSARAGSYGSGGATGSFAIPFFGGWDSRVTVDAERQGFSDDRTDYARGHALWRAARGWGEGRVWFSVDGTLLDQSPASPRPRQGPVLSPLVPVDANQNPDGAFLDDRRFMSSVGFERIRDTRTWTTMLSIGHARRNILRGFLEELSDVPDNARGIREKIGQTDLYVDSHLAWPIHGNIRLVVGTDFLHGNADAQGADFDYTAPLDGGFVPVVEVPSTLDVTIDDRREFFGGYALGEWNPTSRVRLSGGVRLNATFEERDEGAGAELSSVESEEGHTQTNVRPSGSLGVVYTVWASEADAVRLFANYRNTFKPAAIDFGIGEAEGEEEGLLKPETSNSIEAGVKWRAAGGRLGVEANAFLMDFSNLVVAQAIDGLPALANAGTERFKGFETAGSVAIAHDISLRATYSFHDARFRSYLTEFDGVPTELGGKRLEMSARHLASSGIVLAPASGLLAVAEVNYVGSRFLNKRNTALADGYWALAAGVGYGWDRFDVRVDGRNLTDTRPPVAESELGDAQYYLLPARHIDVSFAMRF